MILTGSTFFILQPSLSRLGAAECGWASPPFAEEEEVNPFANPGGVPPASNSRLSPLPPESVGFDYGRTVDIPLDRPGTQDLKKKEKKLQAKEAELRRREQMGSEQLWLSWG